MILFRRRIKLESTDGKNLRGAHYAVVMDKPFIPGVSHKQPYGIRYTFYLEGVIDWCPEYLIPFKILKDLCEEEGMLFIQEFNFREFYEHYSQMSEYVHLLHRMEVIDFQSGQLLLDIDEQDVASLYKTFVFRRK